MYTPSIDRSGVLKAVHADRLNSCWHQFQAQLIESHPLRYRDRSADMDREEAEGEVPIEES